MDITSNQIIYYLILIAIAGIVIYFLRKVSPTISITNDKIKVQKYLVPKYIGFENIKEINMIAQPDSIGADFAIPIIKITFRFKMTDGNNLVINWSNEGWSGLGADKDNAVSLRPETIKKIYQINPNIKLDEFTKDYIETGRAEKFIKNFRG